MIKLLRALPIVVLVLSLVGLAASPTFAHLPAHAQHRTVTILVLACFAAWLAVMAGTAVMRSRRQNQRRRQARSSRPAYWSW